MKGVGVSGHQLRPGIDWDWVRSELRRALRPLGPDAVLWTCLATGADTIAAEEALACGMDVGAVVPLEGYEHVFSASARAKFVDLLSRCSQVVEMPPLGDDEDAYLAAGQRVAELSEVLLLVWDGKPAAGRGGTGDIARFASRRGSCVVWIDTEHRSVRDLPRN